MYSSAYIIRIMKSKGMRQAGHKWETREMHTKYLVKDIKGRDYLEDLGVDSRITLKLIINKHGGKV